MCEGELWLESPVADLPAILELDFGDLLLPFQGRAQGLAVTIQNTAIPGSKRHDVRNIPVKEHKVQLDEGRERTISSFDWC